MQKCVEILILGTIVNGTYGTYKKTIYLHIFTDNIWSYLLWSPVIVIVGRESVSCTTIDTITGGHS